ncbi:MAG: SCP2 sterol-binding domain-containing protein [Pseudomonadota bacterium]
MIEELRMPTLHTAGLAAAESAVNAALRLSPHSKQALAAISERVLAVECTAPAIALYLAADSSGDLLMRGVHEAEVTTRVRGTLEDFMALAQAEDPAAELINGAIQVEGETATLLSMQKVFAELDIDWEAPLVDGLGDVVGHQLAELLRGLFSWSQQVSSSLRRQLNEFAHEEARLAPPAIALEEFYEDVASLQDQCDRLEQRLVGARRRAEKLLVER